MSGWIIQKRWSVSAVTNFRELEFLVADASDLSAFSDGSFDAIVFSFNGLDYFFPEEQRWQVPAGMRAGAAGGRSVCVFVSQSARLFLSGRRGTGSGCALLPENWFRSESVLFSATLSVLTAVKALHSFLRATARISRADLPESLEESFLAGRGLPVRSRPRRLDDALLDAGPGPRGTDPVQFSARGGAGR